MEHSVIKRVGTGTSPLAPFKTHWCTGGSGTAYSNDNHATGLSPSVCQTYLITGPHPTFTYAL